MSTLAFPHLERFLASYFHQDWSSDTGSLASATADFASRVGDGEIDVVRAELKALLGTYDEDAAVLSFLDGAGVEIDVVHLAGTARAWLEQLALVLGSSGGGSRSGSGLEPKGHRASTASRSKPNGWVDHSDEVIGEHELTTSARTCASDRSAGAVNSVTIEAVLDRLRAGASTNRELGDRFERMMCAYLRTDPLYAERFEQVWLWQQWPGRANQPDTGIDLVATERDGGTCAIQCKFYAATHSLEKADIDSFFTASGKAPFTSRLIVSTTDRWSKHAEAALDRQRIPVTRLRVRDLADSPIDWSGFTPEHPGVIELRARKVVRPHQKSALDDVMSGLAMAERGKLIMACGTGKTFTSLRIAERFAAQHAAERAARILFLVPSISLMSQTLREWTAETEVALQGFAVCSDVQVGRNSEDISRHDLAFPATTNAERLLEQIAATPAPSANDRPAMSVIFSTYQSIAAIHAAQRAGLPEFDLVICDEAHRTTGATLSGDDESHFVRVHDPKYIRASRRLYMTATPRLFDDSTKSKADENNAVICSMDDEALYGEELHRLGFGEAVERGLLTDYKVIVLAVEEQYVAKTFQQQLADEDSELNLDDAVKIVGCWNGLSRRQRESDGAVVIDGQPMRRAVAFSRSIKDSKRITQLFEEVTAQLVAPADQDPVTCVAHHVDGTFNALRRNAELDWLKSPLKPGENICRVLSNARCLSEGVDVPALDAVLFLNPRNSVVDVVQSVGRVMRRAEGKDYGYIILPIGVPSDLAPEEALADNKKYKVVWQVLQALRAHDDRFNTTINTIELNKTRPESISIIGLPGGGPSGNGTGGQQLGFAFPELEEWRDAIYAKIVQKCGDRLYWESWAADIAQIADRHTARITTALEVPDSPGAQAFGGFLEELRSNLNPLISRGDAIEMLSQHLITKPVFDALFEGYAFAEHNPVSQTMQTMLDALEDESLEKETDTLERFYDSVRARASGVDSDEGRQRIITELYEKFFKNAFPKMAERLGIVYTPIEVVDFIVHSVEHVLEKHLDSSIGAKGVQVLDPFTGTGTFIVRLLQSGLISADDLQHSFVNELHANEIVLLAYYIAAINIEAAFHQHHGGEYHPFPGVVLTDTFQLAEAQTEIEALMFPENHDRADHQKVQDIRVIISNPPYSVGQASQNDSNQNIKYPTVDKRIEETYAHRSTATLQRNLYDSYIRAIRWATDRVGDAGVVAFVTNGYFIDGRSQDGLRKSLIDEFSHIYCLNLRGNQRGVQGDVSRREGGKIFAGGSRAPVAITILVKDGTSSGPARLSYHDIGDYLSREEKLARLRDFKDVSGVAWRGIVPNAQGDWINQRDVGFDDLLAIGSRDATEPSLFRSYGHGLSTNRDAWVYNFARDALLKNVETTVAAYNAQAVGFAKFAKQRPDFRPRDLVDEFIDTDSRKISWSRALKQRLVKSAAPIATEQSHLVVGAYRPFCKQHVYMDAALNEVMSLQPKIFPPGGPENLAIVTTGPGARRPFSALMVDAVPNLHHQDSGQSFPRYTFNAASEQGSLLPEGAFERVDNISQVVLERFRQQYTDAQITSDDLFFYVYGSLHSPRFRSMFANELRRSLARIPMLDDFHTYAAAGRELSSLHVGYEHVEPFKVEEVLAAPASGERALYRVAKMRFGPGKDRSTIIYNSHLTLTGVPEEAYAYEVNGRPAIEWIMDRYQVTTDKASGIVNDPNAYAEDPRYIVDLIARVITTSLKTLEIVDRLRTAEGPSSRATVG
jgi:predicted helicase